MNRKFARNECRNSELHFQTVVDKVLAYINKLPTAFRLQWGDHAPNNFRKAVASLREVEQ